MTLLFNTNPLERIIQTDILWNIIYGFVALTVLIVTATYYFLWLKKKRYLLRKEIEKSFELWISKAILEEYDDEEQHSFDIPKKFIKHFSNKYKRDYAIEELINSKKNLTGAAGKNIVQLYTQLGFKKYSLRKFESKKWHIKAKGIQELYVMDQRDMLTRIYKLTNSENEYIRMEAQTGIIHFSGFEGLRFLEVVSEPISDWQQVKLLEQLRTIDLAEMHGIVNWLQSPNDTVVVFALKLAEEYGQYQVHDQVARCLQHPNEKVRYQAARTLQKIAMDDTATLLMQHYPSETYRNKLNILEQLATLAAPSDIAFLLNALDEPENTLKLSAARAIAKTSGDGYDILEQKARVQPEPYSNILHHIKAELEK